MELVESEEAVSNIEDFLQVVHKYKDIKALFARVVNDLINKIVIHTPDKSSGRRVQQVGIYYIVVGVIDIPQHIQDNRELAM